MLLPNAFNASFVLLWFKKYFDCLFGLGELLFKSIVKSFEADLNIVNKAFVRPKTLTTLRFNYYPKQRKPIEIYNICSIMI